MHDTCPSAHTNSTCHFRFFGRLHKLPTTPRTCPPVMTMSNSGSYLVTPVALQYSSPTPVAHSYSGHGRADILLLSTTLGLICQVQVYSGRRSGQVQMKADEGQGQGAGQEVSLARVGDRLDSMTMTKVTRYSRWLKTSTIR